MSVLLGIFLMMAAVLVNAALPIISELTVTPTEVTVESDPQIINYSMKVTDADGDLNSQKVKIVVKDLSDGSNFK